MRLSCICAHFVIFYNSFAVVLGLIEVDIVCPRYARRSPPPTPPPRLTCCPVVVNGGSESQPNFRPLNIWCWNDQWPVQSQGCALPDLCIIPKGLKNMKEASFLQVESPLSMEIQISRLSKKALNYTKDCQRHIYITNLFACWNNNLKFVFVFLLWNTGCTFFHGALHVWLSCMRGFSSVITFVLNTCHRCVYGNKQPWGFQSEPFKSSGNENTFVQLH